MLFNSYAFLLLFLPTTLLAFWYLRRQNRDPTLALILAAAVFYAWGSPWPHVLLLAGSICANYAVGHALAIVDSPIRKPLAAFGIALNLVVLGIFKYADFVLAQFGAAPLSLLLPLGISFYTFTQIAYLVDIYRMPARYPLERYALFVTWYPHLIAGPILHHREIIPQFSKSFAAAPDQRFPGAGVSIFVIGLAKKILIADQLAPTSDAVFSAGSQLSLTFWEAWFGALAYTLQLYFDFSGYADMAIGLSLMLGVRLPINFNSPYKSSSIIDFWRRWHMTLSRFLKDYLYISLGGNRHGPARRYVALMVTMLLGGLWHGAGWTFILWGGLHGLYLICNHAWRATGLTLPRFAGTMITFTAAVLAWVMFRASDVGTALSVLQAMLFANGIALPKFLISYAPLGWSGFSFDGPFHHGLFDVEASAFWIAFSLIIVWASPNSMQMFRKYRPVIDIHDIGTARLQWKPNFWWATGLGLLAAASFLNISGQSPFLYFRF